MILRGDHSKRDTTIRTFLYAVTAFLAVLYMCDGWLFVYFLVDSVAAGLHAGTTTITTVILNYSRNVNSPYLFDCTGRVSKILMTYRN